MCGLKIFLAFVFLIPAMLGVAEILHKLKIIILAPKRADVSYNVIFLNNSEPVEQLSNAIYQSNWHGREYYGVLVAVNDFLNEENFVLCKELAQKNGVVFCSLKELYDLFDSVRG